MFAVIRSMKMNETFLKANCTGLTYNCDVACDTITLRQAFDPMMM